MSELVRHGPAGDSSVSTGTGSGPRSPYSTLINTCSERVVVQVLDHPGNAPLGHHLEERGGNQHRVHPAALGKATGSRCSASW